MSKPSYEELQTKLQQRESEVKVWGQAFDALQENVEYANAIMGAMLTGLMVIDEETRIILDVNPVAAEMFGAPRERIIGKVCHNFICPRERGQCPIADLGQSVDRSERVLINVEGEHIPVLKSVTPLTISGQRLLIETFLDITERRRAEQNLRQAHSELTQIFDSAADGMRVIDLKRRLVRVNKTFSRMVGLEQEEIIGRTCHEVFRGAGCRTDACMMRRLLDGGEKSIEAELIMRRPDGVEVPCIVTARVHTDADGKPIGIIEDFKDITVLKSAERSLADAKERAETASQAKSEFLANMSHEIRTPMNGIIGMTELAMATEGLPPKAKNYLDMVRKSSDRLLRLINDILDFSKIESRKLELETIPFDLRDLVEDTLFSLSLPAREKKLRLKLEVSDSIPREIIGDPQRLRQILTNLVGNAIKFTEHGGVTVRVAADGREQERFRGHFSVEDTGIGIAPEARASIFEAFTQSDSSTTRKYGGTGLGLAITSRLVQLMDGEIWVESRRGRGAAFHFTAWFGLNPGGQGDAAEGRAEEITPESVTLADVCRLPEDGPLRILLAEDEIINKTLAVTILEESGCRVTTAETGREVLEKLGKGTFDVVLMDVQMPEMDGIEATKAIREQERDTGRRIPIVAFTAHALKGDRDRCLAAGMDDYLSKPIRTAELIRVLRRQLSRRHDKMAP